MAGIYIHVPFCRKACHYCNFHFSTSLKHKGSLVASLLKEIELTTGYLTEGHLSSIYFGGGTPSLLSHGELDSILKKLREHYTWDEHTEITLEANPEDLDMAYCQILREVGINRLSIGVQSFDQSDLTFMNRAHNAEQSMLALRNASNAGFDNYSIDLMFGLVDSTLQSWEENIRKALSFAPKHLSCYNLTIEEQTAFAKWQREAKIETPLEEVQFEQFMLADSLLTNAGYRHYEISNYAWPDKLAVHNTNYWKGAEYLGIGPAAHSYNGQSRRGNISNNAAYIKSLTNNELNYSLENLSEKDQYNEAVMLGLRTQWGITDKTISKFSPQITEHYHTLSNQLIEGGLLYAEGTSVRLPLEKWYSSDDISAQLFIV